MKVIFDTNGIVLISSHATPDGPVVEIGKPALDGTHEPSFIAFEGPLERQIQMFEAALDLLRLGTHDRFTVLGVTLGDV